MQSHELGIDDEDFAYEDNEQASEIDQIVSELQDILISEEFEEISNDFMKEKCQIFEESETNKQEYMIIFNEYKKQIEEFIQKKLSKKGFQIQQLIDQLPNMNVDDIIVEALSSLSDFELFKDIMVETKIRVQEEEMTIKKQTNKATKGYKQAPSGNIFQVPTGQFDQKPQPKSKIRQDLCPESFFNIVPLATPKITKKK
ncbi:hypothetical protein pb186bvf_008598 [Paramecium bursaria]